MSRLSRATLGGRGPRDSVFTRGPAEVYRGDAQGYKCPVDLEECVAALEDCCEEVNKSVLCHISLTQRVHLAS